MEIAETYKLLGLMLTYPSETLSRASGEILDALRREALLPKKSIRKLEDFLAARRRRDLLELQEEYVDTFDRARAHCLHLFEHVHGESRDRGQAMVNLSETYAARGLFINGNELPDYLPMFLEFLSRCPLPEAREQLAEAIDVIAVIGAKLERRGSPYAVIFEALEHLSAMKPDRVKIKRALADAPKDPSTLRELDEQWREAEAFGDDPAAGCGAGGAQSGFRRQWVEPPELPK